MNEPARRTTTPTIPTDPIGSGNDTEIGRLSLSSIGGLLWSRKIFIATICLIFAAIGFVLTSLGERTYTADTLLVLEDNTASLSGGATSSSGTYNDPNTALQVFGSRQLMETIVEKLDLTSDPAFNPFLNAAPAQPSLFSRLFPSREPAEPQSPPSDELVQQLTVRNLQNSVRFSASPVNSVISISAVSQNPETAAIIANTVAEAFLQELLEARLDSSAKVIEQLSRRISVLRQNVTASRSALQDFLNSSGTVDTRTLETLGNEVVRLRDRLIDETARKSADEALLLQLNGLSAASSEDIQSTIESSPLLTNLAANYANLAPQERVLRIAESVRTELSQRTRLMETLTESLTGLEEQIEQQGENRILLQQLESDANADEEIFAFSLRRLNELSVQSGLEAGAGRIVFNAEVPQLPDGRGRPRTMAILGFLGLLSAIGWVLIRESTNETVRTVDDLKTVMPGMNVIPIPRAPKRLAALLLNDKKSDLFQESIRRLRSSIMDNPVGLSQPTQVVHFVSDLLSTGKSAEAIATARSCALVGQRVLLIEANMRSRTIARRLKLTAPHAGLQSAVSNPSGAMSFVVKDEQSGISLLLAEDGAQNPADVLENTAGVKEMLKVLCSNFDIVIIDSPPILIAPEAGQLARHASRTVFVFGSGASTHHTITSALANLSIPIKNHDVLSLYGVDMRQQQKIYQVAHRLERG